MLLCQRINHRNFLSYFYIFSTFPGEPGSLGRNKANPHFTLIYSLVRLSRIRETYPNQSIHITYSIISFFLCVYRRFPAADFYVCLSGICLPIEVSRTCHIFLQFLFYCLHLFASFAHLLDFHPLKTLFYFHKGSLSKTFKEDKPYDISGNRQNSVTVRTGCCGL